MLLSLLGFDINSFVSMVLEPIFYDISSSDDEEEDHNEGRHSSTGPTEPLCFSKVFNMDVEDDDVVIIDKPTSTGNVKRDKARPIRSALDDDECCMLDTDPGATEITDIVPPLDSDELVMTGEKGPVACRDFPHARYLCVHFPFKTTPHANFCTQCHCYVCDSLAPCSLWGDGSSPNDHCHASEESRWKTLRKLTKCGSVPSRAIPITVATTAIQTATPLPNLNGVGNPTGVSRFVHSTTLRETSSTSPISQSAIRPSSVGHPVGSGVSRQVQGVHATLKKDPLILKLKTKARGKPSQPPHLGVRSPRAHPGNRSLPLPRTASAPTGRIQDEVLPPGVQTPQPPQFTAYSSPGPGRAGSGTVAGIPPHTSHSIPTFNTVRAGGIMPPPVHFSHSNVAPYYPAPPLPNSPPPVHFSSTMGNSNVAPSYYPAPAPPLPNSPPPLIPPPPSGVYDYSPPGVYDYSPPGAYDHNLVRLPGADQATVASFVSPVSHIPDSRYVSASALSPQQVSNVNTAPFYEDHSSLQPYNYVAQDYRSPVDSAHYPSSSYISSNGGNADILAGATEGWVVDAAAHFDTFANGIIGNAPDHDHQAASSLNDVLEQMAGDDFLWEQFPCW